MKISFFLLITLIILSNIISVHADFPKANNPNARYVKRPIKLSGVGRVKVKCSMTDKNCTCWDCYNSGLYVCRYRC